LLNDIIKAHGGESKVETKEGEVRTDDAVGWGSEFIIQLPTKIKIMIKAFIVSFAFVLAYVFGFTQQNPRIDSLKLQLAVAKDDTSRALILSDLAFHSGFINSDSAIAFAHRAIEMSQKINFARGEIRGLNTLAAEFETNGDMPQALETDFRALEMAENNNLPLETSICLTSVGNVFYDLNDFTRAIGYYKRAAIINETIKGQPGTTFWRYQTEVNFGTAFMLNDQLDSSFAHLQKAYNGTLNDGYWHPVFLMFFGRLQFRRGNRDTALNYLRQSIQIFQNNKDPYSISDACRIIATCFREISENDSSIFYAKKGLVKAQSIGYKTSILDASKLLAEMYETKDIREALLYRKVFDSINDILYGPQKIKSLQKTLSDEQDRQRKAEAERIAYQNKIKQYALLGGIVLILLIAFILFRNNRQKKKANILLQQQKEKVESTLSELRSTQQQLIQSEKMASLGELTAGIAHEIQNPLNFVNNFSEVNKEMIAEVKEQIVTGNYEEVKSIVDTIERNEEKINQHGKRADAIVKGMLQHSRTSSGQKELTDINRLADEYLRLAYHGLRARDKSFNAKVGTEFDDTIGKVSIVPQDIGRVILNLINNAFYAVTERAKQNIAGYEPMVTVTTRGVGDKVELRVADNGNGIPERLREKIFQPFFTTKPTGQGTGLGLSLSYDIVKAHDGEINVISEEGKGSEFIIQLPAS